MHAALRRSVRPGLTEPGAHGVEITPQTTGEAAKCRHGAGLRLGQPGVQPLAAPAFHRERLAAYGEAMARHAADLADSWRDGEVRDLHAEMMTLTRRIAARTLFDADVADDADAIGAALDVVLREIDAELRGPGQFLPHRIPTPGRARLRAAVARVDHFLARIIAERRARGGAGSDLLGLLLAARDDVGAPMTDRQLRDEVMTLYFAGHETTANTLAWAWVLLAQHPAARAALDAELALVLGGRLPAAADLRALPYTGAVLSEALRLYPAAWAITRRASEAVTLGGHRLPAGTEVWLSAWVTQRDPRWFPRPTDFDPGRWLGADAPERPRHAYFPFGGGPRVCIGNGFAILEGVLLLATIAQRYRLDLVDGRAIRSDPSLTLRPAGKVRARLTRIVAT